MAILQQPKKKVNIDYDEDETEDDIEFDESDEEDDLPVKPKALPPKRPIRLPQLTEEEEEEEVAKVKVKEPITPQEPQYIQIPKVVSEADMLNIIYEQQIQILNLLQKKDE